MAAFDPLIARLKGLAEPTRLRILAICRAGEFTVSEITRVLGQSQPRVSRHLKKLCDAGLLVRFREGHWVYYRVPSDGDARGLVESVIDLTDVDDATLASDRNEVAAILTERAARAQRIVETGRAVAAEIDDPSLGEDDLKRGILELAELDKIGALLDIGTGTGRMLKLLGPYASSAVGVDISSDMLLVARTNLQAAGLDKIMLRPGDMYRLPFDDASFDTVTVEQVLREAKEPQRALAEAARILRPGGQLLLADIGPAGNGAEARVFAEGSLRKWARAAGLRLGKVWKLKGETITVLLTVAFRDSENAAA